MLYLRNIFGEILGIVFIISGIGKLYNVTGFQYLIIQYGFPSLHYFAPVIVITEIVLGTLLILGVMRKWTSLAAIFLLNRLLIHLHPFIKILTSLPLPPASSLYRATFKSLPTSSKSVGTVNE